MVTLILGGARAGKSAYAERCARQSGSTVTYIATARVDDADMAARVQRHRADRPADWHTVEEPLALAQAIEGADRPGHCVVVDCLTMWLTNLVFADDPACDRRETPSRGTLQTDAVERLLSLLPRIRGNVFFVGNEVGSGIVPATPLGRFFADECGRLNQQVAALADRVVLMVAGCPLPVK